MDLAERNDASIKLAHVHSVFDGLKDSWPLYLDKLAVEGLKRRKEGYLDRVRRRISHRSSVRVHTSLITGPDVADALSSARWLNADIVIMATHARGLIGRFYCGNVVHRLIQTTDLPVMLVPGKNMAVRFAAKPVRNVVIPLDGTAAAERVLKPAVAFGDETRTKYTLLQTVPLVPNHVIRFGALRTDWVPSNEREKHSQKYLEAHAHLLRVRGYNVRTNVISSDDPVADTIRSFAKRSQADLIAVTFPRRNVLSRMLRQNTAEALIRGTREPVFVVQPNCTSCDDMHRDGSSDL
jgi:nucleotide-binding universal stress UspA family protein